MVSGVKQAVLARLNEKLFDQRKMILFLNNVARHTESLVEPFLQIKVIFTFKSSRLT